MSQNQEWLFVDVLTPADMPAVSTVWGNAHSVGFSQRWENSTWFPVAPVSVDASEDNMTDEGYCRKYEYFTQIK